MGRRVNGILADRIVAKISGGEYKVGGRLPSERELARMFGVTQVTVRAALSGLASDGVIEKRQRSGSFLRRMPRRRQPRNGSNVVALVARTEGHFFSDMSAALFARLEEAGLTPIILPFLAERKPQEAAKYMAELESMKCSRLVLEDDTRLWAPPLSQILGVESGRPSRWEKVIWLHAMDAPPPSIIGEAVIMDHSAMMDQAVSELKGLGHARIAYATHSHDPLTPHIEYHAIRTGKYAASMLRHGLQAGMAMFSLENEDDSPTMRRLAESLKSDGRPTAILCASDFLAVRILRLAESIKLKAPKDLSLIGFYDTPWAEAYDLSSVRVDVDEMARRVASALQGGGDVRAPEAAIGLRLIHRGSVGKAPKVCRAHQSMRPATSSKTPVHNPQRKVPR